MTTDQMSILCIIAEWNVRNHAGMSYFRMRSLAACICDAFTVVEPTDGTPSRAVTTTAGSSSVGIFTEGADVRRSVQASGRDDYQSHAPGDAAPVRE